MSDQHGVSAMIAKECQAYIDACNELKKYYRADTCEPSEVTRRYKQALSDYHDYLESIGNHMPIPKWHYRHKDVRTWKYLDVIIGGKEGNAYVKGWVPNGVFSYHREDQKCT